MFARVQVKSKYGEYTVGNNGAVPAVFLNRDAIKDDFFRFGKAEQEIEKNNKYAEYLGDKQATVDRRGARALTGDRIIRDKYNELLVEFLNRGFSQKEAEKYAIQYSKNFIKNVHEDFNRRYKF